MLAVIRLLLDDLHLIGILGAKMLTRRRTITEKLRADLVKAIAWRELLEEALDLLMELRAFLKNEGQFQGTSPQG